MHCCRLLKTVAFKLKVSPWTTEDGSGSSTWKGLETMSREAGANPKPLLPVQNIPAFHSVMVSGTVTGILLFPVGLGRSRQQQKHLIE